MRDSLIIQVSQDNPLVSDTYFTICHLGGGSIREQGSTGANRLNLFHCNVNMEFYMGKFS